MVELIVAWSRVKTIARSTQELRRNDPSSRQHTSASTAIRSSPSSTSDSSSESSDMSDPDSTAAVAGASPPYEKPTAPNDPKPASQARAVAKVAVDAQLQHAADLAAGRIIINAFAVGRSVSIATMTDHFGSKAVGLRGREGGRSAHRPAGSVPRRPGGVQRQAQPAWRQETASNRGQVATVLAHGDGVFGSDMVRIA